MPVHRETLTLKTEGETQLVDVTGHALAVLRRSGMTEGLLHLFTPGATAGLTTIEFEPGAIRDFQEALERVAPRDGHYHHNDRWGDGNGFSHVRSALIGPSLSVPVGGGNLLLGTWQQLVLVDFDNRPRDRQLVATVAGE